MKIINNSVVLKFYISVDYASIMTNRYIYVYHRQARRTNKKW